MSKNQSASGLINVINYDSNGNISFVSGSTTLMQVSSSGAVTVTGVISGSSAQSASLAQNSNLLQGTGSVGFTTTGSFTTMSSSLSSRTTQIENVYATTGSNSFRATQSITGSLTVTGQIVAQTLNVQQVTSSILYSSGSNTFGCDINSRQTFTGSVYITGSNTVINNGCVIIGSTANPACDFFFNVSTVCVGTNATIAQFFNSEYTSGTRGFIRIRNSANIGGTTSLYLGQGQDQKTYIYNNDPSRCGDIVINASGLVGINTASPATQLDVKGMIRSTAGGLQVGKFGLASNPILSIGLDQPGFGNSSIINGWGNSCNGGISVGTVRTDGFAFTVNTNVTMDSNWQPCLPGTYAFVVNGNGNTGVGICNPTAQLHVCSAYSQTPLVVQGGGNGGIPIACFMSGPNQIAIIDDNGNLIIGGCSFSTRVTATTSGLIVNGSMGVGNPAPKENFTIGNVFSGNGGLAFCYFQMAQGVWSTFACVTDGDTNVMTDITYVNTGDFNRSGALIARWAYNATCAALYIVGCVFNNSQNINTFAVRNSGGALQICISGGGGNYKVQALTQGSRATG